MRSLRVARPGRIPSGTTSPATTYRTKVKYVFDDVFRRECAEIIRTPFRAPNANAFAERWVGTVCRDCLDWLLIASRRHDFPGGSRAVGEGEWAWLFHCSDGDVAAGAGEAWEGEQLGQKGCIATAGRFTFAEGRRFDERGGQMLRNRMFALL